MFASTEKIYDTQVIGCGPAGLGLAIAADRIGILDEWLRRGVLFIDKNSDDQIGGGDFQNLGIRSNSAASDYLEEIRTDGVFADVLKSEAAENIARHGKEIVSLELVAKLQNAIGRRLREVVSQYKESAFLPSTAILAVVHNPQEDVARFESVTDQNVRFKSRNVVFATGGKEIPIKLGEHDHKLVLSRDVLHGRKLEDIRTRLEAASCERITVIGGSHSAFSVAQKIHDEVIACEFPLASIDIVHRHPVRLFYDSADEARADGYVFDLVQDVCPVVRSVNRFSGIRGDAKALYRAIVSGEEEHVRLIQKSGSTLAAVTESLRSAAVIVQALGYSANAIPILNPAGAPIGPRLNRNNQLDVTKECRIFDFEGRLFEGAFAIGLGHGITPDPAVGGEPSFRGVLDAVNLYHGKVGEIILRQLL